MYAREIGREKGGGEEEGEKGEKKEKKKRGRNM